MDNLVATNAVKANPTTTATVAVSGSGGLLPNGTYFVSYTFVDPFGESLLGGRSAQFTQTTAATPTVTLPSLPTGVQSINVYLTPTNGAAGTEYLYGTGITATTFVMSYASPYDPQATQPPANSTGGANHHALLYSIFDLNGSVQQRPITQFLSNYLSGYPSDRRQCFLRLAQYEGIQRAWATAAAEIRTLTTANQGTLAWSATGGPNGKFVRTFS